MSAATVAGTDAAPGWPAATPPALVGTFTALAPAVAETRAEEAAALAPSVPSEPATRYGVREGLTEEQRRGSSEGSSEGSSDGSGDSSRRHRRRRVPPRPYCDAVRLSRGVRSFGVPCRGGTAVHGPTPCTDSTARRWVKEVLSILA